MWFLAGAFIVMLFIAYKYFYTGVTGMKLQNQVLLQQVDDLNNQLDNLSQKERKAKQEAGVAYEEKGRLLSLMSHEIRTPMNGVVGMISLLEATELNPEQREYTSTIHDCSKALLTNLNEILINDMLDFSKFDSGGVELSHKNLDLRNCIEEVLQMFALKAAESEIDLVYLIANDVPVQITGDYKRLQQVLINLVENAIKFAKKGEISILVNLAANTQSGKLQIVFTIRDTGKGIAQDKLSQVFKGVLPSDYTTKSNEVIKGFGLVICKRLVEQMGGEITVQNHPGNGCSFIFTVLAMPAQKAFPTFVENQMIRFDGKQILVVDDNIASNAILNSQLEQWKLLPVAATSGKQALEILSQISVDLVITDLTLPEMDGVQLSRAIKTQYPRIPIILLNTVNDERYKNNPGIFNSIVNKPVRQHDLFDSILTELSNIDKAMGGNAISNAIPVDFSGKYPLRILVAEDNPVNQKWIKKILSKIGYECEIAENGKAVLEIVSLQHFDLILMDVQMPEMDGLEASRMIRVCLEIQPVIIAMTANVMQGDREECMQSGMNDYISKPVELTVLLKTLEKWALLIADGKKRLAVEKNALKIR